MRAKIITLIILVVLFTIFITQNTEVITIKAFFWQFEMSAIVLITLIGLIGVSVGFILAKIFEVSERRKRKSKELIDSTETE
jgi:uncharacterized integral membrane protein